MVVSERVPGHHMPQHAESVPSSPTLQGQTGFLRLFDSPPGLTPWGALEAGVFLRIRLD